WEVETPNGTIHCKYLVNAAGLWGREVAKLAGVDLPLMPVEHHYLVTETIPEIGAMQAEIPHISEPSGGYYMRQEGQGVLLGIYEETCTLWAQDGTPMDFGHELLPDDLGRADKVIEHVMHTLPAVAAAGIKRVVNGPMILSPDLSPLVGPHPDLRNYICATGVLSGFNQGGGIGRLVAEWVLDGEPSMDAHFWDVARFGPWADKGFAEARVRYGYENRQKVFFPLEEVPVARKRVTSAVYDRLTAEGAVHGAVFGMEHPLWYAPKGTEARDVYGFNRGNWFDAVGDEARAIRENVGLIDVTSFAKYRVTGAGAGAWLDHLLAGRVPGVDGKTALAPMLSPKGKVIGDFTVSRVAADDFLVLGSGVMQTSHMRWFRQNLPDTGVSLTNVSLDYGGLHLAGPQARALLAALTQDPVSNEAFPFLSLRRLTIAGIAEVEAVRVSFTGELGYEIYVPRDQHAALLDHVLAVGAGFGLRLCGGRAMGSLRLEKGFGSWGGDLSPDYLPRACGLDRFIPAQKTGYIGEDAYRAQPQIPAQQFRQFVVEATDTDCFGGESIYQDGEFLGYVTSAGYGHHTGTSIALGYVDAKADADKPFTIGLLGRSLTARMTTQPLYDPTGAMMRS
ncbi:MAG: FAD-dependent oxidoreductase, partial [Paracoccaceae bacterium]